MAKYRIKIEALDPSEELRAEYRIGMGCDGFLIVLNTETEGDPDATGDGVAWHNLSAIEAAAIIADDADALEVAHIVIGLDRGRQAKHRRESAAELRAFLSGKAGDDA